MRRPARRARTARPLARPYRVLNLDAQRPANAPLCMPNTPVAMANEDARWCLSRDEAGALAAFAKAHGYRVEIVCADEED